MDNRLLADALTRILAPVLPGLAEGGTGDRLGGAMPSGAEELVRALWLRLRQRVEERPQAAEAVEDVTRTPEDPDAQASLRHQLRKLLEADPTLAAELASLIQSGDLSVAKLHGSGAIAQGAGVVAVGAGGIAVGRDFGEISLSSLFKSRG